MDASKLDFGSLRASDLIEGSFVWVNLFDYAHFMNAVSRRTVYALGGTHIKLLNKETGSV